MSVMNGWTVHRHVAALACVALLLGSYSGTAGPVNRSGAQADPRATDAMTARNNFSSQLAATVRSSRPATDKNELARRLKLPLSRIQAFELNSSATAASIAASQNGFWCTGRGCICIGDLDCNDMFSTVCRSPSTGGQCSISGRLVVCTCRFGRA